MIIDHRSTVTMVDDDIYLCLFEIYAVSRMTPECVVILAQTVDIYFQLTVPLSKSSTFIFIHCIKLGNSYVLMPLRT